MTTYTSITTPSAGVNFGLTYTAYDQTAATSASNTPDNPGPPFSQGTIMNGTLDSQFIFIKATAAIAASDVCIITSTGTAAGVTTTNATGALGALVGVAVVAIASGAYGWLQRSGIVTPTGVHVAAACLPYAQLSTSGTAGIVTSSNTTAAAIITGTIITATNNAGSASTVAGTLNYPVVGAILT